MGYADTASRYYMSDVAFLTKPVAASETLMPDSLSELDIPQILKKYEDEDVELNLGRLCHALGQSARRDLNGLEKLEEEPDGLFGLFQRVINEVNTPEEAAKFALKCEDARVKERLENSLFVLDIACRLVSRLGVDSLLPAIKKAFGDPVDARNSRYAGRTNLTNGLVVYDFSGRHVKFSLLRDLDSLRPRLRELGLEIPNHFINTLTHPLGSSAADKSRNSKSKSGGPFFVRFATIATALAVIGGYLISKSNNDSQVAPGNKPGVGINPPAKEVTLSAGEIEEILGGTPSVPSSNNTALPESTNEAVDLTVAPDTFILSIPDIISVDSSDYMDPRLDYQQSITQINIDGEILRIRTAFMNETIFMTKEGVCKLVLDADEAEAILKSGGRVFRIKGKVGSEDVVDTFSNTRTSRIVLALLKNGVKLAVPSIRDYGNNNTTILTGMAADWLGDEARNIQNPFTGYPFKIRPVDPITKKRTSAPIVSVIPRVGESFQEALLRALKELGLTEDEALFDILANTPENVEKFSNSSGLQILK